MRPRAVPRENLYSLETGLLRGGDEPESAGCCPIASQEAGQVPPPPQCGAQQGEEAGEAVMPAVDDSKKAQEHVNQERHPDLPAHGVGAVAEEVGELQGLLDLLEEDLNVPAAAVEIGNGLGAPLPVVGEENHLLFTSVDFDPGHDPAQIPRIIGEGLVAAQADDLIAQDRTFNRAFIDHVEDEVVLGAGNPEDAALDQRPEVAEINVSLVEEDNLSGANARANLPGALGIVVAGGVNEGEAGQEAVEVEPQVALGRRFAPTMLRPVHARGHQLDRGGVDHMNHAAETARQTPAPLSGGEPRVEAAQMLQHRPEQLLPQRGVTSAIGVGQIITRRRRGRADADEQTRMQSQAVADIVEPDGVDQLCVEQRDHMTPRRIGSRLALHSGLSGQLGHQKRRNQIANLVQDTELTLAWAGSRLGSGSFLFHPLLVEPFRLWPKHFLRQPVGCL
jgi:hypothetical protein